MPVAQADLPVARVARRVPVLRLVLLLQRADRLLAHRLRVLVMPQQLAVDVLAAMAAGLPVVVPAGQVGPVDSVGVPVVRAVAVQPILPR